MIKVFTSKITRTHILVLFLFLISLTSTSALMQNVVYSKASNCTITTNWTNNNLTFFTGNSQSFFDNNLSSCAYIYANPNTCPTNKTSLYYIQVDCNLNNTFYGVHNLTIYTDKNPSNMNPTAYRMGFGDDTWNVHQTDWYNNTVGTTCANPTSHNVSSQIETTNPIGWHNFSYRMIGRTCQLMSTEVVIFADDTPNYYPSINSYSCTLTNSTGFFQYKCTMNASDTENDTIYYAISCEEDSGTREYYFGYIPTPTGNSSYYNFKTENKEFLGTKNTVFNYGNNCDFPNTQISALEYSNAYRLDHSLCTSDKHADLNLDMALQFIMKDLFTLDDLNYIVTHSSEVYMDDTAEMFIDYKESLLNEQSSKLILNITRNGGKYYVYSSTSNNFNGSYSFVGNFTATYIRPEVEFYYDTQKYVLNIYTYTGSKKDISTPLDTGTLAYTSGKKTLGPGANVIDYVYSVAYYTVSHNVSSYVLQHYAYNPVHPSYSLSNNKTCNYYQGGTKTVYFYATDNVHGLNDYFNYASATFTVKDTTLKVDLDDIVENSAGEWTDEIQNGFLWGMLFLFLLGLFASYKLNGEISEGAVAGSMMLVVVISLPLMYFNLLPRWFVIIDALVVGLGATIILRFNREGKG